MLCVLEPITILQVLEEMANSTLNLNRGIQEISTGLLPLNVGMKILLKTLPSQAAVCHSLVLRGVCSKPGSYV